MKSGFASMTSPSLPGKRLVSVAALGGRRPEKPGEADCQRIPRRAPGRPPDAACAPESATDALFTVRDQQNEQRRCQVFDVATLARRGELFQKAYAVVNHQ